MQNPKTEGFDVYMHTTDDLTLKIRELPNIVYILEATRPAIGVWVHCTWVWDKEGPFFHTAYYENGTQVLTSNSMGTDSLLTHGPDKLVVGRIFTNQNAHYGDIEIDNLQIIPERKSSQEVNNLYQDAN